MCSPPPPQIDFVQVEKDRRSIEETLEDDFDGNNMQMTHKQQANKAIPQQTPSVESLLVYTCSRMNVTTSEYETHWGAGENELIKF